MTPLEVLERVIYQKESLLAVIKTDGADAATVKAIERSITESKILRSLLKIRRFYAGQSNDAFASLRLAEKLSALNQLISEYGRK